MAEPLKLAWDNGLAWRMRRQLLGRPKGAGTVAVVSRLRGVQAFSHNRLEAKRERYAAASVAGCTCKVPRIAQVLMSLRFARFLARARQRSFATANQIEQIGQAACTALELSLAITAR